MALTEEEKRKRKLANDKRWRDKNKEAISARRKLGRIKNKVKLTKQAHESYLRNKVKHYERTKRYRENNPERKRADDIKYRERHKEVIKKRMADYNENNKEHVKEYKSNHYAANKEKYLAAATRCNKRGADELSDTYIKRVIAHRTTLTAKDIPESLIQAKRAYIKGLRLIKEQEDERQKD
jgi:hypothetical protein